MSVTENNSNMEDQSHSDPARMHRGLALIPVYNEEASVERVVAGVRKVCPEMDILVVDDGSVDGTSKILDGLGVDFVQLPYNLGYGAALQTGYRLAGLRGVHDYVVQLDADGQHRPADIPALVAEYRRTGADMVIGSRFRGQDRAELHAAKRIALAFFSLLMGIVCGKRIMDVSSGFQLLSPRAYRHYASMRRFPTDFPDADVLAAMSLAGMKIVEIGVCMNKRCAGTSMHAGLQSVVYFVKMTLAMLLVFLRGKERMP